MASNDDLLEWWPPDISLDATALMSGEANLMQQQDLLGGGAAGMMGQGQQVEPAPLQQQQQQQIAKGEFPAVSGIDPFQVT